MGKPESWITLLVKTDAFTFRQVNLSGEACIILFQLGKFKQVGTQGRYDVVQVADESIVVINF
jgi:hypothetical protein